MVVLHLRPPLGCQAGLHKRLAILIYLVLLAPGMGERATLAGVLVGAVVAVSAHLALSERNAFEPTAWQCLVVPALTGHV
eukprot:13343098-Heterocapsa_arctica.AAC.1